MILLVLAGTALGEGIQWERSLAAAKKRAVAEGKLLYVDVYADSSDACRQMNAQAYSSRSVREWLGGVVAYRLNADDRTRRGEVRKLGLPSYYRWGLPRIVLLHPTGTVLYRAGGVLHPTQFTLNLAYKPYQRMINFYNARKYAEAAVPMAYLRRYFKGTFVVGKAADELYANVKTDKVFMAAYEKAVAAEKAKLKRFVERAEEVRIARQKRQLKERKAREKQRLKERIVQADEMLKEANKLRLRAKRRDAIAKYKDIVVNFAETPAAETARQKLAKYGIQMEAPAGK